MRGRLGKATMVPDDFRSTDTVRFPTCLDGLRKHFLDITRVLDTTDVDFWRHSIRGAEMDAANTAQTLIEVLLERDVPDTVQLNLVFAQVKAATLDDEFGLGQGVLRKGQRQRKDGMAFSVGPENFLLVQVDTELAVFEGGHGMAPFVMGFVWVVGILPFWYQFRITARESSAIQLFRKKTFESTSKNKTNNTSKERR